MANQNTDKRRPVTWDGVEYASISELARAKGVTRQRVHQWIERGYTGDGDIQRGGRPSKRAEYRAAWRYVRQVNNPQWRRKADNAGLSLSMIGLAYRARTASWRFTRTARLNATGRKYTEAEARLVADSFYERGI